MQRVHLVFLIYVKVERWWFRNKNSVDILRMRNDAETSWSHEYHWFHSCTVPEMIKQTCRACHLQNPKHETHLLNSLVHGVQNEKNCCGQAINVTNTLKDSCCHRIFTKWWKSCYFILNVHVERYVHCVQYNLTHKHNCTHLRGLTWKTTIYQKVP